MGPERFNIYESGAWLQYNSCVHMYYCLVSVSARMVDVAPPRRKVLDQIKLIVSQIVDLESMSQKGCWKETRTAARRALLGTAPKAKKQRRA